MPEFLPFVRSWFDATFTEATPPQRDGWDAIASGRDTLIVAPTGSGKTLASFLWALDHLHRLGLERRLEDRVYVVYISPLRALNNDIEKNLRAPLAGIRAARQQAGRPPGALARGAAGAGAGGRRAAAAAHRLLGDRAPGRGGAGVCHRRHRAQARDRGRRLLARSRRGRGLAGRRLPHRDQRHGVGRDATAGGRA